MSIATKTGDRGETSLLTGERVRKNDKRVEAYGTMDELNSFLGDAKHYCTKNNFKQLIESIQADLFKVCAELASGSGSIGDQVTNSDVENISNLLTGIEKELDLNGFVLPGNSPGSAKLDICRSVARRGEREIISLAESVNINNSIIKYVNRLSDLLFVMARFEEGIHKYV